jgi:hypothetical protein
MKRLNLSLEEWENILNPIWYRTSFLSNTTIETTDFQLAISFNKEIETLGRIRKIKFIAQAKNKRYENK